MKCIECPMYHVTQDCDGDPIIICDAGGDTTNPKEDIFCGEMGEKQEDFGFDKIDEKLE